MMNYPKLGEKYKLSVELKFLDVDLIGEICLCEGDVVKFSRIWDTFIQNKETGRKLWTDSVICGLRPVDGYDFPIPYHQLVELVQCGALIKTEDSPTDKLTKILDTKVTDLGLSVRAINVLFNGNMLTVRDLVSKTESDLLKIRMCGVKVLGEVKAKLTQLGLAFLPPR